MKIPENSRVIHSPCILTVDMVDNAKSGETFGDWLKRTREAMGLSGAELARRSDLTRGYIGNLERNVTQARDGDLIRPSKEVVEALARGLGIPKAEALIAAGYAPADMNPADHTSHRDWLWSGAEGLPEETMERVMEIVNAVKRSVVQQEKERIEREAK